MLVFSAAHRLGLVPYGLIMTLTTYCIALYFNISCAIQPFLPLLTGQEKDPTCEVGLSCLPSTKKALVNVCFHTHKCVQCFFFLHVCIFVSGYLALHSARNSFIIILSFSTLVTGCGDKYGSFTVQSKLSCCFCVLHYNCLPIIIYSEVFSFCHQP